MTSFERRTVYFQIFYALTVSLIIQQRNGGSSQTAFSKMTVLLLPSLQQLLQGD